MNKYVVKYGPMTLAALAVGIVLWLIYRSGKKAGSGNPVITETLTDAQKAEAGAIAKRIYDDLHSGWLGGWNLWGNFGRDADAYKAFAAMGNSMFAETYARYKSAYGSSIIADIRDEGSLPTDTYIETILAKADALSLA